MFTILNKKFTKINIQMGNFDMIFKKIYHGKATACQ